MATDWRTLFASQRLGSTAVGAHRLAGPRDRAGPYRDLSVAVLPEHQHKQRWLLISPKRAAAC
jgi:hypothetical protein